MKVYNVNHISKVLTLLSNLLVCVGIGNTMLAFKTISNECSRIFCSWPNWREKEGLFGMGKSIVLSYKLYISYMEGGRSNVNYYKSVQHLIATRGNTKHPGDFQNKLVSFPFIWVFRYILFMPQLKGRVRSFIYLFILIGGDIMRLPPRVFGCHKGWKSLSFCEIWNNPTRHLFF